MAESKTMTELVTGGPKADKDEEERIAQRDQFLAGRGEVIEQGIQSDFWTQGVLPAIETLYDAYHERMLTGDLQAMGGVKFAQDLLNLLGGQAQMGRKAIHRIAERNFGKKNVLPFKDGPRG